MIQSASTYSQAILSATYSGTFLSSSFTGKEKDSESGFQYFGARYYDSEALTGWLSVDPMADKYPSLSPYVYCANNPVKFTDPDGRWIPGLDDDGNVTYTAEKGDSYKTFIKQFDCRDAKLQDQSIAIFANAGLKSDGTVITEGAVIKGCAVKKATGSDILKGIWKDMTNSQKAAQIIFALRYGEKHKTTVDQAYAIDLNNFIYGFSTPYGALQLNDVTIPNPHGGQKMITGNMRIWPKSGIIDTNGRIPIYYHSICQGENYATIHYYSAKVETASNKISAITWTPSKK